MDTIEFAKNIPAEKLAEIFKNHFEQHMAVYDILRGVEFISINSVDINNASIIYSVKLLDDRDKINLMNRLNNSGSFNIYGKTYIPKISIDNDLLCIMIKK